MKKAVFLLVIFLCFLVISCNEKKSERFKLLTTPIWLTETLLADGVDASGPGGFLEKFKGEAKFREDMTGSFGKYTGKWKFNVAETELTIFTDSLPLPIICDIITLTTQSLHIETVVPDPVHPMETIDISMTFKPR